MRLTSLIIKMKYWCEWKCPNIWTRYSLPLQDRTHFSRQMNMESWGGDAAAQFRGNYSKRMSQLVDSGKNYTISLQICRQQEGVTICPGRWILRFQECFFSTWGRVWVHHLSLSSEPPPAMGGFLSCPVPWFIKTVNSEFIMIHSFAFIYICQQIEETGSATARTLMCIGLNSSSGGELKVYLGCTWSTAKIEILAWYRDRDTGNLAILCIQWHCIQVT